MAFFLAKNRLSGLCWGTYCLLWVLGSVVEHIQHLPEVWDAPGVRPKGFAAQIIHIHSLQPGPRRCFWLETGMFLLIAHESPDNFWDPAAESLWRGLGGGECDHRQMRVAGGQRCQTLKIHLAKVYWCGRKLRAFPWFLWFFFSPCPLGFCARQTRLKQHFRAAEMGLRSIAPAALRHLIARIFTARRDSWFSSGVRCVLPLPQSLPSPGTWSPAVQPLCTVH